MLGPMFGYLQLNPTLQTTIFAVGIPFGVELQILVHHHRLSAVFHQRDHAHSRGSLHFESKGIWLGILIIWTAYSRDKYPQSLFGIGMYVISISAMNTYCPLFIKFHFIQNQRVFLDEMHYLGIDHIVFEVVAWMTASHEKSVFSPLRPVFQQTTCHHHWLLHPQWPPSILRLG